MLLFPEILFCHDMIIFNDNIVTRLLLHWSLLSNIVLSPETYLNVVILILSIRIKSLECHCKIPSSTFIRVSPLSLKRRRRNHSIVLYLLKWVDTFTGVSLHRACNSLSYTIMSEPQHSFMYMNTFSINKMFKHIMRLL